MHAYHALHAHTCGSMPCIYTPTHMHIHTVVCSTYTHAHKVCSACIHAHMHTRAYTSTTTYYVMHTTYTYSYTYVYILHTYIWSILHRHIISYTHTCIHAVYLYLHILHTSQVNMCTYLPISASRHSDLSINHSYIYWRLLYWTEALMYLFRVLKLRAPRSIDHIYIYIYIYIYVYISFICIGSIDHIYKYIHMYIYIYIHIFHSHVLYWTDAHMCPYRVFTWRAPRCPELYHTHAVWRVLKRFTLHVHGCWYACMHAGCAVCMPAFVVN